MKNKILNSALIFVFTFLFMYLLWAFVAADLNAFNWSEGARALLAIFGTVVSLSSSVSFYFSE